MKKILLFLALMPFVCVFVSCKDEVSKTVSIEKASYVLAANEDLEVKVKLTNPADVDLTIPFTIDGDAIINEEYTISADEFVVKKGETSAVIVVSPKENLDEGKSIVISINSVPSGYDRGTNMKTIISIDPKDKLIYSFMSSYYSLSETTDVVIELKGKTTSFVADEDMVIPFVIDEEATTAVLGEHYEIEGGLNQFVIKKGEKTASIKIKFLKVESGKDILKLKIGDMSKRYIPGDYDKVKINIYGPQLDKFFGKWQYKSYYKKSWFKTTWGFDDSKLATLPEGTSTDVIELIKGEVNTLKVAMTGDFGNYFRDSEFTYSRELEDVIQEDGYPVVRAKLAMLKFSKMNVAFSATTETVREGEVGFRIVSVDGKEYLEVTINDYAPVDFLVEEASWFVGDDPKMKSLPLRLLFEEVVE